MKYISLRFSRRIAVSLVILYLVSLLVALSSTLGINRITRELNDLYYQHFQPTIILGSITESLYQQHNKIEELLLAPDLLTNNILNKQIVLDNGHIDSLFQEFTHFMRVRGEDALLKEFETDLSLYRKQYHVIMKLKSNDEQDSAYHYLKNTLSKTFINTVDPLHKLTNSEKRAGLLLYKDAEKSAYYIKLVSFMVIGINLLLAISLGIYLAINILNR